jgi:hypothetical protein
MAESNSVVVYPDFMGRRQNPEQHSSFAEHRDRHWEVDDLLRLIFGPPSQGPAPIVTQLGIDGCYFKSRYTDVIYQAS